MRVLRTRMQAVLSVVDLKSRMQFGISHIAVESKARCIA